MNDEESVAHTRWECKYHVVFIPKYRRKALFRELRKELGLVFRRLAEQKESRVEEGHLMEDHVHMLLSIPRRGNNSCLHCGAGAGRQKAGATEAMVRVAANGGSCRRATRGGSEIKPLVSGSQS